MPIVDSYTDTDPPGYRVDLLDDGHVHVTGHGRDEMHPAQDIASAADWFAMYANDIGIPLPARAEWFIGAAEAAAKALLEARDAAHAGGDVDEKAVAHFAGKVSAALIATGEVGVPFSMGGELVELGVVIATEAVRAKPSDHDKLRAVWDNLDRGAMGFDEYAKDTHLYRAIPDEAISQLPTFIDHALRVGQATKALLDST